MASSVCASTADLNIYDEYECLSKTTNSALSSHSSMITSEYQRNYQKNGCYGSLILHAVDAVTSDKLSCDTEDVFYIVDTGACAKLYHHLKSLMPRITPHYAVKCFPDQKILATLAKAGAGFDCASKMELEMVMDLGVHPSRVIFANPCKRRCDFISMDHHKVQYTTFDSIGELDKIKAGANLVSAVLRIRADDPNARMPFGVKYGALANEVVPLLLHARDIGVNIGGVSFHVGSGAGDAEAYEHALASAREVYNLACQTDLTTVTKPWLVDIGGGFDGGFDNLGNPFVGVGHQGKICVAATVNRALETYFPEHEFPAGIRIISEPGRYIATASACLVTRIIGKRVRVVQKKSAEDTTSTAPKTMTSSHSSSSFSDSSEDEVDVQTQTVSDYYIGDGTYGAFNAILYDGWLPSAIPFSLAHDEDGRPSALVKSCAHTSYDDECSSSRASIFGPTCDSLDMVLNNIECPILDVGDWLLFPKCGAYTQAGACNFNGIPATPSAGVVTHYIHNEEFAQTPFDRTIKFISSSEAPIQVVKNFS